MADNIDVSASPYNDRFDPTSNRTKVLFRPDRPLQQAELNEIQSIAENNIKNLGNSIFKDGAIQTGMSFNYDLDAQTITVEDGTIYLAGKVRQFKKQTLKGFTGTGTEKIGVKVVKSIVDYNTDPTLLDQTQNVPSYLSPGADRLVEEVVLTLNDDSAPTIYEFNDGKLFIDPDRPEFSVINTVLAQRTYEESGSYQVEGFNMWTEQSQTPGMIDLVIDKGVAYVLGYRISKPNATRIQIPKSDAFNSVTQETYTYTTSSGQITIGSNYVKQVKTVVARTLSPAGGVTISKGSVDGRDPIPSQYTNIDPTTLTVYTENPAVVYTYGTDYKLINDSGVQYIDWNTGMNGTEPTSGTTYKLSFEYDRVMVSGTDYQVVTTPLGDDVPGTTTVVKFSGMPGVKPKDNGVVRIDYDYYLARMDLITLDSNGNFSVIPGQPDRDGSAKAPENRDPLTLTMGTVYVYPYSDIAVAQNTAIERLRMEDLQKMKARLENVEYNQAVMLLETQATKTQDPLALRGVFVDAFTDFDKMDMELSSVALSLDDASMTLPVNTPDNQKINPKFLAMDSVAHAWGRIVTAPFKEVKEISQPLATSAWNVNPYQVYNKQGVLTLSPKSDNWIDEDTVVVNATKSVSTRLNRWWGHTREGDPNGKLSDFNQYLVDHTALVGGYAWNRDSLGNRKSVDGIMITTSQSTAESAIMYMRQIEVNFSVSNLKPLADNLYLTFDGIRVDVTPTGNTVPGTQAGTIRANSKGFATGKFVIPAGVRCGTREVTLRNDENLAVTTFTAQGIHKVTTETITTTYVTFNLYDPLAQSFALPTAKVITSIGVYFGSKSTTDNIIMQIRGMSDGGFPNQTVYAERVLTPDQIQVSEDASVETKIPLDDPLMVNPGQSYCIVFTTDSSEYTLWAATLGQPLVNDRSQLVVTQPYVNGVLFSSSNAVSWTVHQETDLKFNVYTAEFEDTGIIEFDTITNIDSDGILLLASYLTPDNTGCTWEVKILSEDQAGTVSIDSIPWVPIVNYQEQKPPYVVAQAKLRAIFQSNRYISPMLALDDLLFVNFVSETSGDYVTKTIDQSEAPFNTIILSYDLDAPTGTSVTPYYSLDGGQNWLPFTSTPTTSTVSSEFTRLTFTERVSSQANNTSLKIKLSLEAENRFVRPRVRKLTVLSHDAI